MKCKFNKSFNLIAALSAYLHKPSIISDTNHFAMNGAKFTLTCNVQMDTHILYNVVFILPDGSTASSNDYMVVSNIEQHENDKLKAHLNLTITNANKERDEGTYKCMIMDKFNNTNSQVASIKFVDKPSIEFEPQNPEIRTNDKKRTARFLVDFIAYPSANLSWVNPKNEVISNNTDVLNRTKYDVKLHDNQIELIVKHPSLEDFGNYLLKATIDEEEFTQIVSLIVSGKTFKI